MPATPLIQPVILSGGSGTRLWPLSTPERPKQLLALTGDETMLQLTAQRVQDPSRFSPAIVVCGAAHAREVEDQLTAVGTPPSRIIVEPAARNTAPAIALAAATVPPKTPLLVMPSDHVINDVEAFRKAIALALPIALEGWIVTFGIEPDRPETGYGYIRRGEALSEGVYRVARFVEKPDWENARRYLDEGDCSWNGGIFLFRAADYLAALKKHAPDVLEATLKSVEFAKSDGVNVHPDREAFTAAPSISIDYAVLEKIDCAAVAPVEMGWSDIGSWDALYDFCGKDQRGNAVSGEAAVIDTASCLVQSTGPMIATIGVEDLIILATPEAVLVMPRMASQRVKEVTEELGKKNPVPPASG